MPWRKKLPKNQLLAYIALAVATVIWGAASPVIKVTLGYIPPLTFLFLRFLISSIILLPFLVYELHKVEIDKRDYLNLFLFGLFEQTALVLIFVGLEYTTVLESVIIGVLGSILAISAGHYFYNEKFNSKVKLGLVISVIGTLMVVVEPVIFGNFHNVKMVERLFGNLLILLYNITWVIYIIWSKFSIGNESSSILKKTLSFVHLKPMKKNYSATLLTATALLVGLITVTPLALLENMDLLGRAVIPFDILAIKPVGILGLLYMSVLSSVVAYSIYQWSLEYVTVSDTAFFGYMAPIITLPVSYILLGESLSWPMLVGALVIALGVIIAEKNLRR